MGRAYRWASSYDRNWESHKGRECLWLWGPSVWVGWGLRTWRVVEETGGGCGGTVSGGHGGLYGKGGGY